MLHADTEVTLLLTMPFVGRQTADTPRPFSLPEYNEITNWLLERRLRPRHLADTDCLAQLLEAVPSIEPERIRSLLGRGVYVSMQLAELDERRIHVVGRGEKGYPASLKRTLQRTCPPVLYYSGQMELAACDSIGAVGSRAAHTEALSFAQELGAAATRCGLVLCSGAAAGIDQAAMTGALESGGSSIAFLSHGLKSAVIASSNRAFLGEGRLLLISAAHPSSGFTVGNAMARNKLIYAQPRAVVVVASDLKKGGTWTGATEALKHEWTQVHVRADDPVSRAHLELVALGAHKIRSEDLKDLASRIETSHQDSRENQVDATSHQDQLDLSFE